MDKNEIKIVNIMLKAFFIVLIIFIVCILFIPKSYINIFINPNYFDKTAQDLSQKTINDKERLLEELQKYADASNFSVEISATMVFQDGRDVGIMNIANPENNIYNMIVDIYINETNKLIYKSGVLKPGDYIENDNLKVFLEKGVYDATAVVKAVAPNTNDVIGEVAFDITIHILS